MIFGLGLDQYTAFHQRPPPAFDYVSPEEGSPIEVIEPPPLPPPEKEPIIGDACFIYDPRYVLFCALDSSI